MKQKCYTNLYKRLFLGEKKKKKNLTTQNPNPSLQHLSPAHSLHPADQIWLTCSEKKEEKKATDIWSHRQ